MRIEDLPGAGDLDTGNGREEQRPASAKNRRRTITAAKVTAAMFAAQAAFAGYAVAQDECPPEVCVPPSPSPCPPTICEPPAPPPPPPNNGGVAVKVTIAGIDLVAVDLDLDGVDVDVDVNI